MARRARTRQRTARETALGQDGKDAPTAAYPQSQTSCLLEQQSLWCSRLIGLRLWLSIGQASDSGTRSIHRVAARRSVLLAIPRDPSHSKSAPTISRTPSWQPCAWPGLSESAASRGNTLIRQEASPHRVMRSRDPLVTRYLPIRLIFSLPSARHARHRCRIDRACCSSRRRARPEHLLRTWSRTPSG